MKHLKLFENFSRHDFGKYSDDILTKFNEIKRDVLPFDQEEAEIIEGLIDELGLQDYTIGDNHNDNSIIFYNNVNEGDDPDYGSEYLDCYNTFYLGDYCYAIFHSRMSDMDDKWIGCEIFDQFDDLCQYIKNIEVE